MLADVTEVLAVLVHELMHHAAGVEAGHRAPFKRLMRPLGLAGKPTATEPNTNELDGPVFADLYGPTLEVLGPYPHAKVTPPEPKKQGTRMLKCECPQCGYICRTTAKWADWGAPLCPQCVNDDGHPQEMEMS